MIRTVLLDPPWMERGGGQCKRGADRHYDLMLTKDMPAEILAMPCWHDLAEDCHMYMWVTNNFLEEGLWLIHQLQFKYKTNLVWIKDRFGLGRYFRGQHELCLFATRGKGWNGRTANNSISSVIEAKRGRHSAKPESLYELIEHRSHGPYLEIFAREARTGWKSYGNELPDYIPIEKPQLRLF